ncbi:hypothetical protein EMIHUDRAFT_231698 [Emiliania huxleyi CCMP1516]|uniref:BTB domain-containing protein n=2 Tax=Emiliania huxleyi TaxID=2903 RepID=A0A0D3K6Z9_EMIH1|nr:hypothetical protein EMIHUDRAFT_231698 [Emiliania huxleyi CCMP1516]EOD31534.1 hypothetical protein EMIHUDRAFT_231698 [Emiliania huxleyi CCMP1516]|eukprot:XP_005783963.1 hypothetical protein EMIHUDRAFT_231698 [Emiliania huxleyi CCMP1516]
MIPLAPCDAGFTPTCEQAKGFGLCDATSSACDTTCVDEVKKACPVTCSLAPEETSGHELWTTGAAPPDYDQPAPAERDAAEITVPKTDLASFTAFIDYLCTDQLDLGEGEGEQARRALVLRELAQMYQVPRLERLCAQALQESVGPASAVPLLEAAHTTGDGRLLAQCRRYVADHAAEVRASGGVEQLRDLGVAKGLLGDALDQVAELKMGAARTAAGQRAAP